MKDARHGASKDQFQVGGRRRLRAAWGLGLVLAVQMLAGHFQLAFYTQVVVLLLGLLRTLEWLVRGIRGIRHTGTKWKRPEETPEASSGKVLRNQYSVLTSSPREWPSPTSIVWIALPLAGAFVLAAVQILPSFELIRIALPEGRNFEYLSGFANTPLHLISYLVPTLFHVNPVWRPVAWDPFHTSPEECFSYVGLLPLCLAAGAAWRWRREPRVRLWVLLVVITLLLSLGPYQPLFRGLIRLPGFGGFRSAARWSLATALFLALLAGRALDGLQSVKRLRLWLRRLVLVFVIAGGFGAAWALGMVEGGSPAPRFPGAVTAVQWADRIWTTVSPWENHNELIGAARATREPPRDPRAICLLAGIGYRVVPRPGELTTWGPRGTGVRAFTLAGELKTVMLQELVPPAVMLGLVLGCLCFVPWNRSAPRWLLLGIAAAELGATAWLRPTEFAPRGRLIEQSSVLSFLAANARGERVWDSHQNLAMITGSAAVNSYRTVDIEFATRGFNPDPSVDREAWAQRILDRCDTRWHVWDGDPEMIAGRPPREGEPDEVLVDPVLARILYGSKYVNAFGRNASTFVLHKNACENLGRGWYWDARQDAEFFERLQAGSANRNRRPSDMTYFWLYLSPATRVPRVRAEPELQEFEFDATGPGMLAVSELDYPGWEAKATGPNGTTVPARDSVRDAGCQLVRITLPGHYRVQLKYRSRPYELGRAISLIALLCWLVALLVVTFFWGRRSHGEQCEFSLNRKPKASA